MKRKVRCPKVSSPVSRAQPPRRERGVALVSVLLLIVLLAAVLAVYAVITVSEVRTENASHRSIQGFYTAEGGLNMRAELVRALFFGYNQPSGTSPTSSTPCIGNDQGTGDFACKTYAFTGRNVSTYVRYTGASSGKVTTGSYTGLNYQQYSYDVRSIAYNTATNAPEASLEMTFQSRLIPLFQFAAFYQRDLELHPGANTVVSGRVHTNANLYLNANPGVSLQMNGLTDAAGNVFRYSKDGRACNYNTVYLQGNSYNVDCSASTMSSDQLRQAYGGNLLESQPTLTVPTMSSLAPVQGNETWDKADLRIVVFRNANGSFTPKVVNADGSVNASATLALTTAVNVGNTAVTPVSMKVFADYREQANMNVIAINQSALMDAIALGKFTNSSGGTLILNDSSDGGLIINVSFNDSAYSGTSQYTNDVNDTLCAPTSNSSYTSNQLNPSCRRNFGVYVTNASTLGPDVSVSNTSITGLSIITNQPIYLQGDYNTLSKKPASIMADAINILSNDFNINTNTNLSYSNLNSSGGLNTVNSTTTVNAAFLSGIDDTINGSYNGGLQNYMRFHEAWGGKLFSYTGSFVSLGNSKHVGGAQNQARYTIPSRSLNYDTSFDNAASLPPLTPRAIILRQLLFSRNYN